MYDVAGLELAVLVGSVVVALTMAGRRVGVSPPVLLLAGGVALSFLPGFTDVRVAPEAVVLFILPALLYWEARTTSLREIRSGLAGVLSSAVVLVLLTAGAVAAVAHSLGLAWPGAFVLGAVVAPTDATAVGSVAGRLPPRELTTLRAESLINDGTALTLFAVAAAAATGAEQFSPLGATARFGLSYVGGAAVGLVLGLAAARFRRLAGDPVLRNAVTVVMPFASFLVADLIEGSGVLAVVVYGLTHARLSPRWIGARTRLQSQAFWSLTAFLLNGALFVLVGLQLRAATVSLPAADRLTSAATAGLVLVTVAGTRLLWFLVPAALTAPRAGTLGRVRRKLPLAWAGFRGGVSLAAALAVPAVLVDGSPFPGRATIIVTAATVIVATLVGQGLTLPLVLRAACYVDDPRPRNEQRLAEHRAAEAALDALPAEASRLGTPASVIERVRAEHEHELVRTENAPDSLDAAGSTGTEDPASTDAEAGLRLALLSVRRTAVVRLRDDRLVDDLVLMRVQSALDMEEARLRPLGGLS